MGGRQMSGHSNKSLAGLACVVLAIFQASIFAGFHDPAWYLVIPLGFIVIGGVLMARG